MPRLLLAVFVTLLHRYTGQNDFVIGVVTAGGLLPLRCAPDPGRSLPNLAAQLAEALDEAGRHAMPCEAILAALAPHRSALGSPLLRTVFAQGAAELAMADLGSSCDLALHIVADDGRLQCRLHYAGESFRPDAVRRMLGHFQNILASMLDEPGQALQRLNLLSSAERRQLLVDWNDTAAPYSREQCIHELFEGHAAATPQAVALSFKDIRLGYGELNTRANQLAHHLRALGVGPEILVAIYMERCPEMVVAILAIFESRRRLRAARRFLSKTAWRSSCATPRRRSWSRTNRWRASLPSTAPSSVWIAMRR